MHQLHLGTEAATGTPGKPLVTQVCVCVL